MQKDRKVFIPSCRLSINSTVKSGRWHSGAHSVSFRTLRKTLLPELGFSSRMGSPCSVLQSKGSSHNDSPREFYHHAKSISCFYIVGLNGNQRHSSENKGVCLGMAGTLLGNVLLSKKWRHRNILKLEEDYTILKEWSLTRRTNKRQGWHPSKAGGQTVARQMSVLERCPCRSIFRVRVQWPLARL